MIDYGQYDQLPPVQAEIERMYQRENDRLVNSRYECYEPEETTASEAPQSTDAQGIT